MQIENNKLEIAEITLNENQKLQKQVEEMLNEKLKLEHQLTCLENQKNDQEADLLSQIQSYQEYAKQIEDQFRDSSNANQSLADINEAFLQRERNLTRHINELETQLEDVIKKKQLSCTNCAVLSQRNADLTLSIAEIRNGSVRNILILSTCKLQIKLLNRYFRKPIGHQKTLRYSRQMTGKKYGPEFKLWTN